MGAPTMADVGRAAVVSAASAPRALSDGASVSPGLHKRMIAAVTQVGYRPERAHKGNVRPPGIALLLTHVAQQFCTHVTIGIEELAAANGSMPFIFRLANGREQLSQILRQMYPPLTTVRVPQRRIGLQMASLLEELTGNSSNDFGATVVNCSLIVRRSTGPAPG